MSAELREIISKRNNVNIIGNGPVTVMFAHGFGCDQNTWRSIIPAFEHEYKLVLFDYVGSGNSDLTAYHDDRYSTLDGYALDVIEICREFELRDVIFIGHSVSSMIGVLASLQEPAFFKKLILIGPSPRYINDQEYIGGLDRKDLEELLDVMDQNYLGWSKMMAPSIMGNSDRPHLAESLTQNFCAADPEIAKKFARVTFLSDNRKDLSSVTVPSLTIQCEDDFLTSKSIAGYIQQHMPKNQVVLLDTSGHCPHLSDPEGVIGAIKSFITC
ncbi:alpha/beta fold hydrolase [Pedobacter metabolipauper]|uniref:Sigma-B regulation protein RsbQ n=1 Tax=Pedobacter metabolipauper TaxID=425513 RepID=A0A4R6SWU8_9SPHI|nr:alpha/beta hydrolase [Pedobacter metabolipauper]TDQ09889.1 sigma-B regulation protein RsbQ [Pedobacter metabolipauper]